ncbi:MAG: transferrin receptor-like dimerization domain-containing protein [Acidobacteriota bacterium]|nr:transferrin receptor-like dimerization domain-containing protein [Acidobacteriota bacterium]
MTKIFLALIFMVAVTASAGDLIGFSEKASETQQQLEKKFDTYLDANMMLGWMEYLTRRPHHAGSPKVKENAEWMAEKLRSWGFETEIEVFHVLIPRPLIRELTLLEPARYEAVLKEPTAPEDPVSKAIETEGLPPYNAYSADGDVTAELVYVNQGLPRDYEELELRGIDVKGKIVLARYGGSWRGIKPKLAYEKGAIGCLIYNDPKADGFYQGDAYPDGAFKHDHAVQRGSVLDLPLRPGDPLTPGWGATKDAKRIAREDADNIMKIPVLPISYHDAKPLMEALGGETAPPSWRGAMPVTYRIGPGPAKVRLKLKFDWKLIPAYNVIAKMKGSEAPDQWVIRGNHHDAWVVGATDPISGIVPMLAQAYATGQLAKTGWRPKRTLVFCAWDAEEPALLGSTDWVEHHADELKKKTVAYINTDGSSRGFLGVGGSHALEKMVNQVARDVPDPQTKGSVADRRFSLMMVDGGPESKKQARARQFQLGALGSGSDYTAFFQHLGLPTLNLGFGGEGRGGEYHTNFDTFAHYTRHRDPGLVYGVVLASVCGRLSLRLSEARVLPFDFTDTLKAVSGYVDEVVKLADDQRKAVAEHNELLAGGHYQRAADPKKKRRLPKPKSEVPYFNFAPLHNAVAGLKKEAAAWRNTMRTVAEQEKPDGADLQKLNALLYSSEQAFLGDGLPRRPWFRHQIYAPGFYTGYGVKTLPGIREGIEEGNYKEAQEQIHITAAAIDRLTALIRKATAMLP